MPIREGRFGSDGSDIEFTDKPSNMSARPTFHLKDMHIDLKTLLNRVKALEGEGILTTEAFARFTEEANEALVEVNASDDEKEAFLDALYELAPFDIGDPEPAPIEKAEEDDYDRIQPETPQLAGHDLQIPEEPETVRIVRRMWEGNGWRLEDQGERMLVPTGCDKPNPANPYHTEIKLKSALPRDIQETINRFIGMLNAGLINRHEAMKRLEMGLLPSEVDRGIMDDAPIMDALRGQPDPGAQGIAQTSPNRGQPVPDPGPGGRAQVSTGELTPPPNGAPGTGV